MKIQELSKRIREVRDGLSQTQEEAAREIGVTLTAFCRWERGERTPRGLYLEALNKWLKGR